MIKVRITGLEKILKHKKVMGEVSKLVRTGLGRPFVSKKMGTYRIQAQKIVLDQVYRKYTPKKYNRTFNLLKAIHFKQESKNLLRLEVTLGNELRMVRPKGNEFYPILVIKGVTSTYPVKGYPKRDFYYSDGGWLSHFQKKFTKDYYNSVVRRLLPR